MRLHRNCGNPVEFNGVLLVTYWLGCECPVAYVETRTIWITAFPTDTPWYGVRPVVA